ncbi:hypothetical protein [Pseudomonas aeruginosa]
MTNLQIAALVQPSMVTQLLTADGGEWEVSKHLQEFLQVLRYLPFTTVGGEQLGHHGGLRKRGNLKVRHGGAY